MTAVFGGGFAFPKEAVCPNLFPYYWWRAVRFFAVYNEIAANLLGNAPLVAAGIVAVNRAQERGYTIATAV